MISEKKAAVSNDPWSAATWEGCAREQLLRFADATPAERFRWLCDMYEQFKGVLPVREDRSPDW